MPLSGKPNDSADGLAVTVMVEKGMAERVREVLLTYDLFDPARSIGRADGRIHFPVLLNEGRDVEWLSRRFVRFSGHIIVREGIHGTRPRPFRVQPMTRIRDGLRGFLKESDLELLPGRWEMIGDVLVLKLDEILLGQRDRIARTYMEVLGARYALLDRRGIAGELREPQFEVLVPPSDGRWDTVHVEGGIRYHLDPKRIMFSSGNVCERTTLAKRIMTGSPLSRIGKRSGPDGGPSPGSGELIVDMFAGIGYFSIPLAVGMRPKRIIACEKNPLAFAYLVRNIAVNGVDNIIIPVLGDNREVLPSGLADRVVMGYVGGTLSYMGTALSLLSRDGGMVHLHDTIGVEVGSEGLFEMAKEAAHSSGWNLELMGARRVKSYAPRVDHVALDILVKRSA